MAESSVAGQSSAQAESRLHKYKWTLGSSQVGISDPNSDQGVYSDRSIQVTGTFSGTTVLLQGSNDGGANWATLTDPAGNAIAFSAAGIKQVTEVVQKYRPYSNGGDSLTAVEATMFMKKQHI